MVCYHPQTAYYSKEVTPNGKRKLVFNQKRAFSPIPVRIPCCQCIGCKLEKSRQWAVRMMKESSLHDDNCFLTLTYSPDYLPDNGSLVMEHVQAFMKRLRDRFNYPPIKVYYCGEYGDNLERPHYHLVVFGLDFADKYFWRTTDQGDRLFRSPVLESLWTFGHSEIGSVTFESCGYVSRYVTKKITGPLAESHYSRVDVETGEIVQLLPEFANMSRGGRGRRGGIAKEWFDKFHADVYPHDNVVVNGCVTRPPRYFDMQLEKLNPDLLLQIKQRRIDSAKNFIDNNTPDRLHVREQVKLAQTKVLLRKLESKG